MKTETIIGLGKGFFSNQEKVLLKDEELEASIFNYESGVSAVKLKNRYGYIIVLPYKGQQIWDAYFGNRSLRMRTNFKNPKNVDNFVYTYGAFLMHCGALRMGCPGPKDVHPLHGELPYVDFSNAELIFGKDNDGRYIGITGIYEYNKAFSAYYIAKPEILLNEKKCVLNVSIEIKNLSNYPMELMYMTHINFNPVNYGKIIQSVDWEKSSMEIRGNLPDNVSGSIQFNKLIDKLREDPKLTQIINPEDIYNPEVVFYFKNIKVDNNGFAHFLQKHPDGSSDYVSFNTKELDHGARWIVKNKDMKALGIVLPSTCDADGYIAEKEKGNIKEIKRKSSYRAIIKTGYLNKKETEQIEKLILLLIDNKIIET